MKRCDSVKSTLKDLLDMVTDDNVHAETDTGFVEGKEIW